MIKMKAGPVVIIAAMSSLLLLSSANAATTAAAAPDPTRLELSRAILNANGGAQAMEKQMRTLFTSMVELKKGLENTDPKVAEASGALWKYVTDEEIKEIPQLIDQMATIYARNLSETELRDMLAWYRSPSGRAIHEKLPIILQQYMAEQAPLLKRIMAGAAAKAVDQVCADVKCNEDQRRTIAAMAEQSLPKS